MEIQFTEKLNDMLRTISDELHEKGAASNGGKLQYNGDTYTKRQAIKFLNVALSGKNSMLWKEFFNSEEKDVAISKILRRVRRLHIDKVKNKQAPSEIPEIRFFWEHYSLFRDIKSGDRFFVKGGWVAKQIDYDTWLEAIPKGDREVVARPRLAIRKYNPYTMRGWEQVEYNTEDVVEVNTYVPPKWRFEASPDEINIPKAIDKVLRHLFPNDLQREFVLDWLHNALLDKNETFLVLNGAKGVGKGIFCDICKLLVGPEHYSILPESVITSHFNSVLKDKRLLVMDEYDVDRKAHTKLKRFINPTMNIEEKGKDANEAIETFNSYVISNNNEDSMHVEWDDRRFSIPDLSGIDLQKIMDEDEINELSQLIKEDNQELAVEWGNYILHREPMFAKFKALKGDTFWKLVYVSLKNWQKYLVDKIIFGDDYEDNLMEIDTIRSSYKREERGTFPNRDKVADFLKNYRHNGGKSPLGEVVLEDGEFFIKIEAKENNETIGDIL